jgi:hypothetical protein
LVIYRNDYLAIHQAGVAICGKHVSGDSIHVGLLWQNGTEAKIIHFLNGNNIPVEEILDPKFDTYFFNHLTDFPEALVPSLAGLSELISENKLNGFVFSKYGVVYDGGKFEFINGTYNTNPSPPERYVNCGVFTVALLNTYGYKLLNWNSWPLIMELDPTYFHNWLVDNHIPVPTYPFYYRQLRAMRGKHIFVAPNTATKPSEFSENEPLAQLLIESLI